jgi:ribosomal-protein-alanine N-acetyltransferase
VILRNYRPEDAEAMYALDMECFAPPFRFSRRAMRGFAEAPGAVVVVADAEGHLAGFCIVHVKQRIGYVVTLNVAAAGRRQGLARELMAETEQRVRLGGGAGMALHVFTGNDAAIRFYERSGYVLAGEAKGFYERGLDALVYRKDLGTE